MDRSREGRERAAFETTLALLDDGETGDAGATLGWTIASTVDATVSAPSAPKGVSALPAISYGDPRQSDEEGRRDLEVLGELGRGGMGVVLHARQHSLDRDVAIKCVTPEHGDQLEARALMFEAQVTGSLEHPNIVPVHALGVDAEGRPSMVMKRISGVEWAELLGDAEHDAWEALPRDRLRFHLETLIHVCHALAFAHDKGIVHRDVKPANVMVGAFGEVVLLDWGVALRAEEARGDGPPMPIVGTPAYMAPEMASGSSHDERTDVYLVGATLYEILTGDAPHDGSTLKQVLFAAASARRPAFDDAVPTELGAICARAMEPDPADRFPSVEEMRKALGRYLHHRSSNELVAQSLPILERIEEVAWDDRALAESELTALRQHYAECRFGLRQALIAWEDNPVAADGLERCIRAAARVELSQRNADVAAALLDELEQPDESLVAELRALREERAEEQQRLERLERDARERDANVSARGRGIAFIGVTAAIVLNVIVVEVLLRMYRYEPTPRDAVLANTGLTLAIVAAYPLYYRRVERTRHNLAAIRLVFLFAPFTVLLRLVGWHIDLELTQILTMELVACALATGLLAITYDRRLVGAGVLTLALLGLALAVPRLALESLVVAELGTVLWIGGAWFLWSDEKKA